MSVFHRITVSWLVSSSLRGRSSDLIALSLSSAVLNVLMPAVVHSSHFPCSCHVPTSIRARLRSRYIQPTVATATGIYARLRLLFALSFLAPNFQLPAVARVPIMAIRRALATFTALALLSAVNADCTSECPGATTCIDQGATRTCSWSTTATRFTFTSPVDAIDVRFELEGGSGGSCFTDFERSMG